MAESGNLRSLVAREVYIDSTVKTGTIERGARASRFSPWIEERGLCEKSLSQPLS